MRVKSSTGLQKNNFGRRSLVCSPTPLGSLSLFDQVEANMISYSKTLRTAALLCTILTAGLSVGQDGVVRMSDRSNNSSSGDGVVQMSARRSGPLMQHARHSPTGCGESCTVAPGCAVPCQPGPQPNCGYCPQPCQSVCNSGCSSGHGCNCGPGCHRGSCYAATDCNTVFSSGDSSGMPANWCQYCNCVPCQCRNRHGRRYGSGCHGVNGCDDGVTLFAHSVDSGTGSACRDCYRGQSMSFHNKNARLADKLFGWMIPSGCCGQGCPPVGAYHMTYADQPDYINPNDTQIYATHQYGMPITVPLAPNVNHTYNYSAGIPSSRITTIGNYNPQTAPQRLPHQTW